MRTRKLLLTCKHASSAFLFSVILNSYSGVVKTEVQFTAPRLFIFSHRVRDVRRGQGEGTGILPQERIAKLLRGCRIVLRSTEMPRHGSRGKELSSHGWRVATVSSGIENQNHNSYSHLAAKHSSRGSMPVPSPCPWRMSRLNKNKRKIAKTP